MKRPSSVVIAGVLACVFAGCASLLAYNYLKKQGSKPFQGVAIVSAATDVPIGTKLDATHVRLATWPKENLPSGFYTDANTPLGRIAVRPLSAGDIVTEAETHAAERSSNRRHHDLYRAAGTPGGNGCG